MKNLKDKVWEVVDPDDNFDPVFTYWRYNEIIEHYFWYWCSAMEESGKKHLISKDACVLDWIVINWATEVTINRGENMCKCKPSVDVKIVYLENYNGGPDDEPLKYEKDGDSGFDLRVAASYAIAPGSVIIVKTGIKVAVPQGYELQVRTRSGSPVKRGFVVANSPGTVDSGYRGEVGVIVHNISDDFVFIDQGERIAQGVICPVYQANFIKVEELDETERGENGYNSTGVK